MSFSAPVGIFVYALTHISTGWEHPLKCGRCPRTLQSVQQFYAAVLSVVLYVSAFEKQRFARKINVLINNPCILVVDVMSWTVAGEYANTTHYVDICILYVVR